MDEGKPKKRIPSEPKRAFEPEKLLRFIELEGFSQDWEDLRLTDKDLLALQMTIMSSPQSPPVIPRTNGLRKLRFAPAVWAKGKRGAARVCFVHFPKYGVILLVTAYAKNEKDDLLAASKQAIKKLIEEIEGELGRGRGEAEKR